MVIHEAGSRSSAMRARVAAHATGAVGRVVPLFEARVERPARAAGAGGSASWAEVAAPSLVADVLTDAVVEEGVGRVSRGGPAKRVQGQTDSEPSLAIDLAATCLVLRLPAARDAAPAPGDAARAPGATG